CSKTADGRADSRTADAHCYSHAYGDAASDSHFDGNERAGNAHATRYFHATPRAYVRAGESTDADT
ncbi:MAG: hypothetical protein QGI88_03780, partial [SAR202 cluster bacterium]|nr:hypothetical protein [SAR202 cluster bacterium]